MSVLRDRVTLQQLCQGDTFDSCAIVKLWNCGANNSYAYVSTPIRNPFAKWISSCHYALVCAACISAPHRARIRQQEGQDHTCMQPRSVSLDSDEHMEGKCHTKGRHRATVSVCNRLPGCQSCQSGNKSNVARWETNRTVLRP